MKMKLVLATLVITAFGSAVRADEQTVVAAEEVTTEVRTVAEEAEVFTQAN